MRHPFFQGKDNPDQLVKIAKVRHMFDAFHCCVHVEVNATVIQVLGSADLFAYLDKYGLELEPALEAAFDEYVPWLML